MKKLNAHRNIKFQNDMNVLQLDNDNVAQLKHLQDQQEQYRFDIDINLQIVNKTEEQLTQMKERICNGIEFLQKEDTVIGEYISEEAAQRPELLP